MKLTEKYRPQTFEDFKGSALVASMLSKMVKEENLPNCLLFSGPRGTGKTSMARILNNLLNDESSTMSYIEVDAASNNGVENIRSLQETIRYSHPGSWRIVVLDEAHSLSSAAFNALLKVLEEPPNKTVFILITTKPETIPDTVKSRASTFRFNQMDVATIALRLHDVIKAEALPIRDPKVLIRIAEVSEGSMRGALVLLEQLLMAPEINVEAVNELSGNTVDTKDLIYTMLSGDLQEVEVELANIFSRTGDVDKLLTSLSRTLKEFHKAGLLNNTKFLACMGVVWNMRKLLRGNDEVARTQLEAGMFAMFAQNFWNGEEGETKAISEELTTEDISSLT